MYKKAVASFWTVEEVDLSQDLRDWERLSGRRATCLLRGLRQTSFWVLESCPHLIQSMLYCAQIMRGTSSHMSLRSLLDQTGSSWRI